MIYTCKKLLCFGLLLSMTSTIFSSGNSVVSAAEKTKTIPDWITGTYDEENDDWVYLDKYSVAWQYDEKNDVFYKRVSTLEEDDNHLKMRNYLHNKKYYYDDGEESYNNKSYMRFNIFANDKIGLWHDGQIHYLEAHTNDMNDFNYYVHQIPGESETKIIVDTKPESPSDSYTTTPLYSVESFDIEKSSYDYTGDRIRPNVKNVIGRHGNERRSLKSSEYSVFYINNRFAGTAQVCVMPRTEYKELNYGNSTGINYGRYISKSFTIKSNKKYIKDTKPHKTSIVKIKRAHNGVRVYYKIKPNSVAYEIQYSTKKTMKNGLIVKNALQGGNILNPNIDQVKIQNLKKKKTYYFRVRATLVKNGKTVYSSWSKIKKYKIKK